MIFHGIQATKTCRNPGLLRALGRLWQGICGQGETWNLQGPDGPEFCFHMAFSKSRAIERYQWMNLYITMEHHDFQLHQLFRLGYFQ